MKPTISLRKALADKQLLGKVLSGDTWLPWRVMLIAAMGEALRNDERALFTTLTGRQHEPGQRVEELAAIVGRRGGKSRALSTLAAYIAGMCKHDLAPGECGVLLLIAPDQKQAGISLEYCTAAFEQSPILKQLIANRTAEVLTLTNGISIEVRAASFRRLSEICKMLPTMLPSAIFTKRSFTKTIHNWLICLAVPRGVEPPTFGLGNRCSIFFLNCSGSRRSRKGQNKQ